MIVRLALRSLLSRPVRSAVLAGGFGLGVAVMAALLGIGDVILDQARAPELVGGGDVLVGGASGRITSAKFVLSGVLGTGPLAARAVAAAPTARANVYLLDQRGATPIRDSWRHPQPRACAERSGNQRGSGVGRYRRGSRVDARRIRRPSCDRWIAFIRFPTFPHAPSRGRSGCISTAARVPLVSTSRSSPVRGLSSGRRPVAVRLQLERGGLMTSFSDAEEIDDATLLATAPDLTAKSNRVRLSGREYRISIDLPAESGHGRAGGDIVIRAIPGRSLPPFSLRGAAGWVSGYTVPVMAAELDGEIRLTGLKR